jgi:hypothetical protein
MPQWLKDFFAKDIVKVLAGGLYFIVNGLILLIPDTNPIKTTLLAIWNGVITPALIALGVISGGTSNLRSNASREVTDTLKAKGVVGGK